MLKSSARFLLATANLLLAGSAMAATTPVVSATTHDKIETLNAASVKAVEGSWLEVPNACKARGYNADAKPLAVRLPRAHVRDIYKLFAA